MNHDRNPIYDLLTGCVREDQIILNEPMSRHTTFRIGGSCDWFVTPEDAAQVRTVVSACRIHEIPYFLLGNGSNLLVSDAGFRGVVIQIFKNLESIDVSGDTIRAEAGALLSSIASSARDAGLTGLEFASGIPGTLGGAVTMNAGAYGGEMKDVLRRVTVLNADNEIVTVDAADLALGYRTSRVKTEDWIVLEAELTLQAGDPAKIAARMDELKEARVSKQPLNFPSAGSTFKRPPGAFAGKLIMEAGLAGAAVGDAQISEKHCGFLINRGAATAEDVMKLIRRVQAVVQEQSGILLEPEIKLLGEFAGE